jgi:hypothetical protein
VLQVALMNGRCESMWAEALAGWSHTELNPHREKMWA